MPLFVLRRFLDYFVDYSAVRRILWRERKNININQDAPCFAAEAECRKTVAEFQVIAFFTEAGVAATGH